MAKKLISYDDQKPGLGLPDPVEKRLDRVLGGSLPVSLVSDATVTLIGSDPIPIGVIDGVLYGSTNSHIWRSHDSAQSWEQLAPYITAGGTARRVFALPDGEIAVLRLNTISRSTGWATNPKTATFANVLGTAPRNTHFHVWGMDHKNGKAIVTEYDVYTNRPWRVWISLDACKTFTLSMDLETVRTPEQLAGTHMHGVAYDEYRDRFFFANGDDPGTAQVWYSDDDGDTWVPIDHPVARERQTSLMPMENGVLIGTDAGSDVALNGMYRMDPHDPTRITLLHEILTGGAGLTHISYSQQVGSDGIGYMPFGPYQPNPHPNLPSVLLASTDGISVQEIWRDPDPLPTANARIFHTLVGPDANGKIIGHLTTTTDGHRGWLFVATAPRKGSIAQPDMGRVTGGRAANQTSTAVGVATVTASDSLAVGNKARVEQTSGTAVGQSALVTGGTRGVAIGAGAKAAAYGAVVVGAGSTAGQSSVIIGEGMSKMLTSVIAIGKATLPDGVINIVTIGVGTESSTDGVSVGHTSKSGWRGTALGKGSTATQEGAVALGYLTAATAAYQVAVGPRHIEAVPPAAAPAAPVAGARIYTRVEEGKVQVVAQFPSGSPVVISQEA